MRLLANGHKLCKIGTYIAYPILASDETKQTTTTTAKAVVKTTQKPAETTTPKEDEKTPSNPDAKVIDPNAVSSVFRKFITSSKKANSVLVNYSLRRASSGGVCTVGRLVVAVSNWFDAVVTAKDVPLDIYNEPVNFQPVIITKSGDIDSQNLFNLFSPAVKVPSKTDEKIIPIKPKSIFHDVISSNRQADRTLVNNVLQKLEIKGVKTWGPIAIDIADVYGFTLTVLDIPPKVINLPAPISSIRWVVNRQVGPIDARTFFINLGPTIEVPSQCNGVSSP